MTQEDKKDSFWGKLGSNLAKGTVAAGKVITVGCVFVAKHSTKAATTTGKAFKKEWQKQTHK